MPIQNTILASLAVTLCFVCSTGDAQAKSTCPKFDVKGDSALESVPIPPTSKCKVRTITVEGVDYSLPDSTCTPGAVNPHLTLAILKASSGFHTSCERNKLTSAGKKNVTYSWYEIAKPADNREPNMVCELDHLVSIEIGGADSLDNIWPQCGPYSGDPSERQFKMKDNVENFLAAPFRAGKKSVTLQLAGGETKTFTLKQVQKAIATDWTQFLPAANKYYASHKKPKDGG